MTKRAGLLTLTVLLLLAQGALFLPTPGQAQIEMNYGIMPVATQAPIIIGQRKGFFEAEGIRLKLVRMQSGSHNIEAMVAGSVQGGHAADGPLIHAAAAGLSVVAVADNSRITKENTQLAIVGKEMEQGFRPCQYGPWLASPPCGVDRVCALVGQYMPPRQARGQPLHPIYGPCRCADPRFSPVLDG